jgi:hypothetical protein
MKYPQFPKVSDLPQTPQLTTIKGITSEVYTSALNYFAPVVAIYRAFQATAGIPTTHGWWQSREVEKDRAERR